MEREDEKINVWGARVHNLKNIDVEIPRNSLTVIPGLSGSGKSSLAFDTIFAEGQRRYIETFSAYARNFLGGLERPDVDKIALRKFESAGVIESRSSGMKGTYIKVLNEVIFDELEEIKKRKLVKNK